MISTSHTVTTTPVKLLSPSNSYRTVYVHIVGAGAVYFGGADVTTANGLPTEKHTTPLEIFVPAEEELWAVSANSEEIRFLKPALYAD